MVQIVRDRKVAAFLRIMRRIGQNRLYIGTPYMIVYLVNSLPKIPCIHPYIYGVWPTLALC
jgi:hypothetical protein